MDNPTIAQLFDLSGKVAVVTGGALGIGQGIAFRLAEAGATVVITDLDMEAANQTAEQISKTGGKAVALKADAASVEDAKMVANFAVEKFGKVDILVNNAGIFPMSPALETTENLWDKVIDINLKGVFFYTQALAQKMIEKGNGGSIINIASIDALHPTGNLVHYDASKGGVVMMTKSLALELGKHNIRVNAIAPGGIRTPGASKLSGNLGEMPPEQIEAMVNAFMARIPLGRQGEPDDIAKVVLFLASSAAAYMTGATLIVDGGFLLS
jgi:2-dehydro-3-deoxy-D-gluconate 5-dehydrogenase